ncbi:MAG: saccharopine dehydrogenase family protein [Bacteroidota bacterium]
MKALVIGAGMMGSALAYDFARSPGVQKIYLADIDGQKANEKAKAIGGAVEAMKLDTGYYDEVIAAMKKVDVAVGATSYTHNFLLAKAAIESGIHFCDLGGNMDVVDKQLTLDAQAKTARVCIIPNCGLAPGMACAIAAGAAGHFQKVDEIHIRVGGLPQHPVPPLNYQLVFSPEGLINEYLEPAEIIRNGSLQKVESMIDLEQLSFPQPFEKLEAFNTSGGISTLTRIFKGKVKTLDYKTIRYPGHCEKFKLLLDLGFAGSEPVAVGNTLMTTREFFETLLMKKLPSGQPDVVLTRIEVKGVRGNKRQRLAYEMVDYYDTVSKMTSMARTTSFPTSIIAQMIVNGTITARGVHPPEECVPLEPFIAQLKTRNIIFRESVTE